MRIGEMTIGDRHFSVVSALIWADMFIEDGDPRLTWSIDIKAKKPAVRRDDPHYPPDLGDPHAYANNIQINVRAWKELQGTSVRVEDQQGPHISIGGHDPMVRLYVWSHELLLGNEIQIGRRDGNQFEATWLARTADLQLEENVHDAQYPFQARCPLTFAGVRVTLDVDPPDSDVLQLDPITQDLKKFISVADLRPPVDATPAHWRQHGMRLVFFRPRTAFSLRRIVSAIIRRFR